MYGGAAVADNRRIWAIVDADGRVIGVNVRNFDGRNAERRSSMP